MLSPWKPSISDFTYYCHDNPRALCSFISTALTLLHTLFCLPTGSAKETLFPFPRHQQASQSLGCFKVALIPSESLREETPRGFEVQIS